MSQAPDKPFVAVQLPNNSGGSVSMGVAAPVGAVSRKDRERAARTSLLREEPSPVVLTTELPGTALLQRRASDGTWEVVDKRPTSRRGSTRLELPTDAAPSASTFRVVFSPQNANLNAWVSEEIEG